MTEKGQVLKGAFGHIALFFINFCVMVGIVESLQIFNDPIPFLNLVILGYMLGHTTLVLAVQLGVQILELIRVRMPTLLPYYYFQFDDEETIPLSLLDPTKSKLAVLVLFLVISGAPVFFPLFAIYGFLLVYAYIVAVVIEPSTILEYFEIFLNWMPPVLILIFGIIIISIVIIEFRHI